MALTLSGRLLNVYSQPSSTNKTTGEIIPQTSRVQLLTYTVNPLNHMVYELKTLRIDNVNDYDGLVNKDIAVDVGVYNSGNTSGLYVIKGTKPRVLEDKRASANAAKTAQA